MAIDHQSRRLEGGARTSTDSVDEALVAGAVHPLAEFHDNWR